jgi:quercetin dioxygenase-like cupin family protein
LRESRIWGIADRRPAWLDGRMTTIQLPDGATIEFLTPVEDGVPCVMRGTIPAGGVVPLHSHADPETFVMLEGEMEGYSEDGWLSIGAGDSHHIPGHVRHAWRNPADVPAVSCLVSTATIGLFFREVAASPEEFLAISDRNGYWNATPEENAAIGLTVPVPARP